MESKKTVVGSDYAPVQIPTNQMFLTRWYAWTNKKVLSYYKRDRERALDSVQNVRLRLLSKDFIGRWFFKHLTDDLVDRSQAEKMLGGQRLKFMSGLKPVVGLRGDANSLYRIIDILKWSKFNYSRYYYSIQNHTIDSEKVLGLLGYEPGRYTALQSLYRQGRLLPSEFTEHTCLGNKCDDCIKGRESLHAHGVSLASNWNSPGVSPYIKKLRWNDSQLRPFLRDWRHANTIKGVPDYVMRPVGDIGIDAGLLKYAEKIVYNTVVNDFKSFTRSYDLSMLVLDGRKNPEFSDGEMLAWEGDEDSQTSVKVVRDVAAHMEYRNYENCKDLNTLVSNTSLTPNERKVLDQVDFNDRSIRDVAEDLGLSAVRVNKIRQNAIDKMSLKDISMSDFLREVKTVANKYGINADDVLDKSKFGPQVVARAKLFGELYDLGYSVGSLAEVSGRYESEIAAAINKSLYLC